MTKEPSHTFVIPETTKKEVGIEVLRQTERHLEEQRTFSSAADQRALAFSGILIVIFALLVNAAKDKPLTGVEIVGLCCLVVAAALSIYSARPVRVYGSGGEASGLLAYLEKDAIGYFLSGLVTRNDRNILHNDIVIKQAAKIFRYALLVAFLGILIVSTSAIWPIDFCNKPKGLAP